MIRTWSAYFDTDGNCEVTIYYDYVSAYPKELIDMSSQHLFIDFTLPPGIVLTRWVGETWKLALPPDRVDELADYYENESKKLRKRAPVQAGGEMPAGSIAWYEFEQIHAAYAQRFGALAHNPESIINRGGFTYQEIQEYISKDPETWTIQG